MFLRIENSKTGEVQAFRRDDHKSLSEICAYGKRFCTGGFDRWVVTDSSGWILASGDRHTVVTNL